MWFFYAYLCRVRAYSDLILAMIAARLASSYMNHYSKVRIEKTISPFFYEFRFVKRLSGLHGNGKGSKYWDRLWKCSKYYVLFFRVYLCSYISNDVRTYISKCGVITWMNTSNTWAIVHVVTRIEWFPITLQQNLLIGK